MSADSNIHIFHCGALQPCTWFCQGLEKVSRGLEIILPLYFPQENNIRVSSTARRYPGCHSSSSLREGTNRSPKPYVAENRVRCVMKNSSRQGARCEEVIVIAQRRKSCAEWTTSWWDDPSWQKRTVDMADWTSAACLWSILSSSYFEPCRTSWDLSEPLTLTWCGDLPLFDARDLLPCWSIVS